MAKKPILCLDFDGVLHSYTSGWKGASVISDPPMPGALQFIVESLKVFDVAILSSRSHQWGGRRAMKRWLRSHLFEAGLSNSIPEWWSSYIFQTAFADPWDHEVAFAADNIIKAIRWPIFKPPAMITIDDRALRFNGTWPAITDLQNFRPFRCPPLAGAAE